jgi:mRNA-degrading endonuclease toxin of MazEF toxin-antitoxin module
MAIPLSSKVAKSRFIPMHIPISPPEGGLKLASIILCDQTRALSKDRLGKAAWGSVSAATMAAVEKALRVLQGL